MDMKKLVDQMDIKRFYETELNTVKWNESGQGMAKCPFHDDHKPSLSIESKTGRFNCFGCGKSGSVLDFYGEKHGADYKTAKEALVKMTGATKRNAKTYDYKDENGTLLFQVVRSEPKGFIQRRPDGKGKWIYNLKGIRVIPYNLPDVLKKNNIIIVEGEKDADNLNAIGFTATCNPMGAGKWKPEYNEFFKDKTIAVIPDNDEPGNRHSLKVAQNLKGTARSVKIVKLADLPEKGDVSDWIEAGGTKEALVGLIKEAPEYEDTKEQGILSSLLKWNDIMDMDISTEYLLEMLIPKGSITLLFSRGGMGKTSLCMQITRAIAGGLPFGDLQTIKTPVIYIDFENPLTFLKERTDKIGMTDNFWFWHISNTLKPPRLDNKNWELYKQLPPGLIVFDTLRASHLSDENDSKAVTILMSKLKELRELGFTVLLLHHTPKGNEGTYKGSTAIIDLVDHSLALEETKGEDAPKEFSRDKLYRLGTKQKTRYEPHSIYLNYIPKIKGFEIAKDPDIEIMEKITQIINRINEPVKQGDLIETIQAEHDLSEKEIRRLLKKGVGLWKKGKGEKNATLYSPIDSVLQFGRPIYDGKTAKQENGDINSLPNTDNANEAQGLDNSEFGSFPDPICKTEKQDCFDLEAEEVEFTE